MAVDQVSKRCRRCQRHTLHERQRTSEMAGCFLTLITGGLFLPIWLLMSLCATVSGYRCQQCGQKN